MNKKPVPQEGKTTSFKRRKSAESEIKNIEVSGNQKISSQDIKNLASVFANKKRIFPA